MTLTNSGMARSAIDIYPGATLNLHITDEKKLIVDSRKWKNYRGNSGV